MHSIFIQICCKWRHGEQTIRLTRNCSLDQQTSIQKIDRTERARMWTVHVCRKSKSFKFKSHEWMAGQWNTRGSDCIHFENEFVAEAIKPGSLDRIECKLERELRVKFVLWCNRNGQREPTMKRVHSTIKILFSITISAIANHPASTTTTENCFSSLSPTESFDLHFSNVNRQHCIYFSIRNPIDVSQ